MALCTPRYPAKGEHLSHKIALYRTPRCRSSCPRSPVKACSFALMFAEESQYRSGLAANGYRLPYEAIILRFPSGMNLLPDISKKSGGYIQESAATDPAVHAYAHMKRICRRNPN